MFGTILQIIGGNYYVYLSEAQQTIISKPLGIFRHEKMLLKPMVGDIVDVELKNNSYLINHIYERKCEIKRPKVANIDLLILVISWTQPSFNHLILNKYLAYYEYFCPNVAIAFTKSDLICDELQKKEFENTINEYKNDGYLVFDTNNQNDLIQLKKYFTNQIVCFIGNSGVGKSTLINKLAPHFNLKTQSISMALNRGKHTTTSSVLLPFLNGFLVDTPGFATLDIDLKPEQLARAYHDYYLWASSCKFNNCLHTPNSKDCKVIDQIKLGNSSLSRYQDYLYLLNEIKNNKNKYKS